MLRSGRSRRRFLALSAYYALALLLVGPMWFAPVEADTKPRIPVLISLNVALRTRTTDVATFTTPFPITVGVAGDGTFTIPRSGLAFALVDVPLEAAHPGLGRLSVRAEPESDFGGTVDTATGEVSLTGFLELLWTRPHPRPNQLQMVDCPVGPFALHLSTLTIGGSQLARHPDPTSSTARLVDDNLAIDAIPPGIKACAGAERTLNQALSLPIVPRLDTTTSTSTSTSTTLAPSTTTTSEATTTTTVLDPDTTTTTVDPTATTIESTTTTVAAEPVKTPNAAPPDAADLAALAAATPPTEPRTLGGPGTELDPEVLSIEPIPSIVSTLTIAAVPADNSGSTPTTQSELTPNNTPTTHAPKAPATPKSRQAAAAARDHSRKHKPNKHAQTTTDASPATATPVANPAKNKTPPLYFSPLNFGAQKAAPHNRLLTPAPIIGFGADVIAKHRDIASIIFLALLILPLIAISGGLVAADFGAKVPFFGRRRRRAKNRSSSRLLP